MVDIDLTPKVTNLKGYAGSTITLKITVPAGVADGFIWDGQVRLTRGSDVVDATWDIVEPSAPGDPAFATLRAVDTARLVGAGTLKHTRLKDGTTRAVQTYKGEYDIQARPPTGTDPVYTWTHGTLTLTPDVTRLL